MSYGGELSGKLRRSPYVLAGPQWASGAPAPQSPFLVTPRQLEQMAKEVLDSEAGGGTVEAAAANGREVTSRGRRTAAAEDVVRKTLDPNRYATKKTIAQGMLDVALLTANASQLRYVLQVGEQHEFYTLMVTLITVSIFLQVLIGVLSFSLNLLRDCRLHREEFARSATAINYTSLSFAFGITVTNVMISAFDVRQIPGREQSDVELVDISK